MILLFSRYVIVAELGQDISSRAVKRLNSSMNVAEEEHD